MAEEPQPSTVQEGADAPDVLPANAEDRKAAKAMSSLDARGEDETTAAPKKEVDVKALTDAMKMLETGQGQQTKPEAGKKKEEEVKKPLVKVDQADVALLVEQLDMSKTKATELLRAHDADAVKAMQSWVTAAV
ncbi:hypothetical protein LTR37_015330 [Vermiconidia calcicola]|uniref:Uncharacterized protein n=1 Tax=Vermiconidia calcicola TaxID=1690605 RepID=A0ACC3MR38_9PEZI|nr:hypothetical protein LTR37_015330 [Vermiconidia calcicola]